MCPVTAPALPDDLDHPPLFDDELWWDCKICGRWRPDEKISVKKRLSRFQFSDPYDAQRMGTLYENVRHCNDKPDCRRIRPLRCGTGVTPADLRTADIFAAGALSTRRRPRRPARPAVRTVVATIDGTGATASDVVG